MLSACMQDIENGESYCLVQAFIFVVDVNNSPIMNEMECPLLEESHRFSVIPSVDVLGTISLIHECDSSCMTTKSSVLKIERETVITKNNYFKHNYAKRFYSFNVYCIQNHYEV